MHTIIRLRRPDWDRRINAALASSDLRALTNLEHEAAAHAACSFGPSWLDAQRAHARVQAARRFLGGRRHG